MRKRLNLTELENRLHETNPNLDILYEINNKEVMCFCNICKQEMIKKRANITSGNAGCSICHGWTVVKGINDFATKAPELMKYLINKEDGYTHTVNSHDKVELQCPDCGYMYKKTFSHLFLDGFNCVCQNKHINRLFVGINDINTKANWMTEYLLNKEDSFKYSVTTTQKTWFKCIDCGYIEYKNIGSVFKHGYKCIKCGDGISYPNKFLRFFLDQTLARNIEYEFSREWTNRKQFDAYFEYNNKAYCIEMDGGFHSIENNLVDISIVQQNDKYKDKLLQEHDIIGIRIDASISNKDYIQKNIENSILSDIFDLTNIDWALCDLQAQKSILVKVCQEYDKDELLIKEISQKYNLSTPTIRSYIKKGYELGLCHSPKDSQNRSQRIKKQKNGGKKL